MLDVKPFLVSVAGCLADYLTTVKGLGLGFVETHVQYSPFNALVIFTVANGVLALGVPSTGRFKLAKYVFAFASFLGAVNNVLFIGGVL